ncbi:histidine ammonia-lyase [Streptomyces sp. NBC_01174]|uniref:HAL/PAL/TAL family ammonia-lyase n=1 Tax=Streptomyces sp. NBC_01174 TaxID=2903758 RepID=UPI00386F98E0|nr:aromatic amino acid ammonia-lyase [Streptomyces sp. NBC_01177]WSS74425.1 aromatic amino acid ammonia-lyase [Streptomyces sp. NBC_01174]
MNDNDSAHRRPVTPVLADGHTLTLGDVAEVALNGAARPLSVPDDAVQRMNASLKLKQELIEEGAAIYGVTSGFGDSSGQRIPPEQSEELQRHLVRFLGTGVGPIAPADVTRATMLIRANCLARGHSAVRPELVQLLVACLSADILPRIPERGSVGASGDLVPLSYIARLLTGTGEVHVAGGGTGTAEEALKRAGLTPVVLEAKEGLALLNGTSFMSGFAALAVHGAQQIAFAADLCTALTSQLRHGNPAHFEDFLFAQKPHPGTRAAAARLRELIDGSGAYDAADDVDSLQDPYSIRCAPHVTGVLADTLTWVTDWMTTEINSSNDNPLFNTGRRAAENGGNFYGGHVGLAMDALKTAVASVGDLLDRQLELVVDEKFNDLTANLAPHPRGNGDSQASLNHGFKGMQITASALVAEALKNTMSATSFSRSTEAHNQDKVSMGTIAARDAHTVTHLVLHVTAIHLLALCQAADLRGPHLLSPATRTAYDLIRTHSPYLDTDRPLDQDIETITRLIADGTLKTALTQQHDS